MKRMMGWLALVLSLALCAIPTLAEPAEPVHLVFATMQEGTGAYAYASALAGIMEDALPEGSTVELKTTSPGAVGAPEMLEAGECDLVMSNAAPALWYAQRHPNTRVRALCGGLGYDFVNVMMTADFAEKHGVFTLEEVLEKQLPVRLVVKEEGSLGELAAKRLLEALRTSYTDIESVGGSVTQISSLEIVEAFEKGEADVTIDHIAAWQENTTQLCERVPMIFPQLKEETLNRLTEMGFGVIDVEPGMFAGQAEALAAVGSQQVVLVREDMDNALAQALARAVCEHSDDLARISPALERFVPMYAGTAELCGAEVHAGAAQYYWEQGYPQK